MKNIPEYDLFITQTLEKMLIFNDLETLCRNYYLLGKNPSAFSTEESLEISHNYHKFANQMSSSLPFTLFTKEHERIVLVKHARYLPSHFHTHAFVELFYVISGQCTHTCKHHIYELKDGDFCFWEYNVPHEIRITSDADHFLAINILLSLETMESLFLSIFEKNNVISEYFFSILYGKTSHPMIIFHTGRDKNLLFLICKLYEEYQARTPYYQSIMYSYLMDVFVCLLRNHSEQVFTDTSSTSPDSFLPVLQYIQENYSSVTLQEVCNKYHYAPAYLSRLIKKYTGSTFSKIISDKRMEQAEYLLIHTSLSITDIAQECGFHDASHFNTSFRKRHHLSPGQYRTQASKNLPEAD